MVEAYIFELASNSAPLADSAAAADHACSLSSPRVVLTGEEGDAAALPDELAQHAAALPGKLAQHASLVRGTHILAWSFVDTKIDHGIALLHN